MATTQTYMFSAAAAVAAGIVGTLAGAGLTARAGVPATKTGSIEFRATPSQANAVENFLQNAICPKVTGKLEGCSANAEAIEATIRWTSPTGSGPPTTVSVVANVCKRGTWRRNAGAAGGVQIDNCAQDEAVLTAQQRTDVQTWLTTHACPLVTAQMGDCVPATDARELTFRWDRGVVGRDPLTVTYSYSADGTWVRSP
jgi:hypothetical protein